MKRNHLTKNRVKIWVHTLHTLHTLQHCRELLGPMKSEEYFNQLVECQLLKIDCALRSCGVRIRHSISM
jgi:hypothetical protein